jgi:hypothetical protein
MILLYHEVEVEVEEEVGEGGEGGGGEGKGGRGGVGLVLGHFMLFQLDCFTRTGIHT